MTLDALSAIRAAEVESPSEFDGLSLEAAGGMAFDLPQPDVVVRPQLAVSALKAKDARIQVYEYSGVAVFQGCRLIKESSPPFVLFAFGGVTERVRIIDGALRVYSDDPEELSQLAEDPSLCFAEILDRYALDYSVGEGSRARFAPVVLIPQEKLDLTEPILAERVMAEIITALDVAPAEDTVLKGKINIPTGDGSVMIFWPFALNVGRYVSDVRERRQR